MTLAVGTPDKGSEWAYFSVWKLPSIDRKHLFDFDRGPVDSFEQAYFTGSAATPPELVAAMMSAYTPRSATSRPSAAREGPAEVPSQI